MAESLRTRPGGITVLVYTWKDIRANGTGTEADDHMVLLVNDSTSVDEPNLVVVDLAASRDRNTDNDYGPEDLRNRRALLNRAVGFDDWHREQGVFINRIPADRRRFETIEFDRDGNLISGSRAEAPDAENLPTHRQVDVPSSIQDETNALSAGQPWLDEEILVRSGPTGAHTNTAGRPLSTSGRIGSRPSEEAPAEPDEGAVEGPRSEITEASIAGVVASILRLADWAVEDQGYLPAQDEEESANFRQQMYLLNSLAENARAGGVVAEVLAPHVPPDGRLTSHPPIRMLHAVNQRALAGLEPDIARWYPFVEGGGPAQSEAELERMVGDYLAAISANRSEIAVFMQRGTQTNDPARARLLYPLEIIATELTGLPLRVLEYGACGGLNSFAHMYRYEFAGVVYGDPEGKAVIGDRWSCPEAQVSGVRDLMGIRPEVLEVRACDLDPLQAVDEADQQRLAAGFFDTEIAAVRRILNAFEDVRRAKLLFPEKFPAIESESALTWLPAQLGRDRAGSCTVIWDSMLRRYLSEDDNKKLDKIISNFGARATPDAPIIYGLFETIDENGRISVDGVETLVIRMFLGDGQTKEIHIPTQLPNRTPGFDLAQIFTATGVLPPRHHADQGRRGRPDPSTPAAGTPWAAARQQGVSARTGSTDVPNEAETFDLHVRGSGRRFGPDMDATQAFHHSRDGGDWTDGAEPDTTSSEPGTPISGNRTGPGKPTEPATPWSGRNGTAAEPNKRARTGPDRTAPVPPLAPAVGEVATDGISGTDPSSPPATPIAPAEPDGGAVEGPRSEITEASIAGAVASIAKLAGWLEEDQGHLSARNEEESANFRQQKYLLDALAANAQAGGVVAELMAPHVPPNQRLTSHPPTRMLHAVNQRVLAGLEPDIAVWYPVEVKGRSADEQGRAAQSEKDLAKMASAYLAAISANRSEIAEFMQRGTQTSSPARARLQLPLRIIATILTGKPLRVFEYAACGGFNSMGHLFQIAFAGDRFGDPEGVTVIGDRWSCPESQVPGVKALLGVRPEILEVKCSDLDPLQAADEGDRFRLAAGFMHTDIGAVRDILNASKDAERAGFPAVEQADALDWLPIQLARDRTGSCTVIWDSMLRRYLSEDDNEKLDDMINDAGARATRDNPLIYGLFETRDGVETLTIRMFLGDGQTKEIHIPTLLPNRTPGADIGHIFTATGVLQRLEVAACLGVEVGLLGRPERLVDAIDAVQGQLRHLDEQGWRDLADRDLSTLPQWLGAHASLAAEMADARSRGASGDEWQALYGRRDRLRAELATLLGLPQLRTQWIGAVNEDPVFEMRRLGEYTQAPEVQRLVEACSQLLEVEFGADQVAARLGSLTGTRPADPPPVEMPSQAYRELAEEALHKVATEATEAGLDRPEDLRRRGAPAMAISHGWDFWLTDAEKDALIAVHPNKVGGSRGIPPDRLNEANERSLRRVIQRLDARPPGDLSVAERQQLRYATRLWDGLVKADHLARTREGEFEVLLVEFDAATLVSRVALRMTPLGADAVQWWHLRVGPDAGAWPEQLFEPGPARDAMMVFGGRRTSPPLFEMSVGPRGVEGVRLTDDESAREASSAGAALAKWLRQRDWCSEELIATIESGVAELVQRSQADSTGEILVTARVKGTDPGRREVVVEVIDNNPASPEVREFSVARKAAGAGVVRLDDRKGTWLRFGESLIDSLLPPNVPNVQGAEIIGAEQVRARGGADAGFECGRKVLRDLDLNPDVAVGFRVENRFAGQLPWPEGLVGAICAHPIYAAAVVGRKADWRAIGLGVQESTSFPRNPGDEGPEQFGRSEESAWMPQVGRASLTRDGVELEKLLRAAKDAVRDAMNTVGPKLIRDDRITVIFNSEPGTFEAHIRTDGLDFTGDPVEIVPGRFGVRDGCIVAVVAIPREEHSGSIGATEKRRTEAPRHRAPGGGGHQSRVTSPDEGNARPADGPASPAPDRSADGATPTPDSRRGSDDLNMAPATARGGITVAGQVKAVVRSFALNRRPDQISFTRDLWVIRTDAGNNNINITVCDSGGRLYLVRTRIPGASSRDLRIANEADIHAYMMDWVAAPMLIAESETGDPAYAVYEHIRGATLNDIAPRGDAVPDHVLGDIANTFGDLRRVPRPPWIPGGWPDNPVDQQEIRFEAMQEVYRANKEKYKHLYEQLGVDDVLLNSVRIHDLDDRPPRIRHNDVHRKNVIIPEYTDDGVFIPPAERRAVVIDWELATWGDPLGDLAVHLHKMGYLPGEELDLLTYWQAAEPDAVTTNWRRDLAAYRNFERVNSLVTEAVLYAEQLASGTLTAAQEQELIRKLTDKRSVQNEFPQADDRASQAQ
ncbi:DUF2332 family protein [Nocardia sp. NPDC050799]|uniref:DUF2332 family protein n=1 Tax=Nocardia sp. NPDC050799 TaxID=3154842 RepID=UPI0033D40527